jgi:PAS domain S-box-containing protein
MGTDRLDDHIAIDSLLGSALSLAVDLDHPAEQIEQLQRCISDLVALVALPASWAGADPRLIAGTLIEVLVGMLALDLVFVRLIHPSTGTPIELARVAPGRHVPARAHAIGTMLDLWLGENTGEWPAFMREYIEEWDLSVVALPVGLRGDLGVLIACSERANFPTQTERLLLTVAKNQALIALREARILSDQKHVATELDLRVARRTAELSAVNEDLRRAEEALRASEINLRQVVDSIPGFAATLNPAGQVEHLSRELIEYFGKTLEELKAWQFSDAVHPDDLPRTVATLTRSIQTGDPYDIEHRCRRADGVYRWFKVRALPVRDMDGHITGWYVLLVDIDDRKRAEEAIQASERNLKQIINAIPALAWSARPDGAAEFFNGHYLDYIGLSATQARDWGWTVAVHPDDLHRLVAAWEVALASGQPGESEARLRRADGEYRWFLVRVNPLRNEGGSIVKWYGTNTDIDDRKRAEEELRRSEAFLAEAQRLSLTGSFWWRVATDEIAWSGQVYRTFEIDPAEPVTLEQIQTRIHPDDRAMLWDVVGRARAEESDFEYELRLLMPDHSVRFLHVMARAARHQDGSLEYIGAVQDVTERRRSEQALDKARSELARVARVTSLGALTASIAHEVNQPLSGIVTNASTCLRMLAADPPNLDGARETARRTIRDGHRASQVITRLRGLFGRRDLATEPVDLNEAIREVVALSTSELQRHRVVLRLELVGGLPPVPGDRVQLQQVILNLLLNASDAMREVTDRPRQLVVRTERSEDGGVTLLVRDSGVGFESQDAERLFEAFYTTKRDGMGIGLSLSRSIIERHHGRLWATPSEGSGATFAFTIPVGGADTKV